MCRPNEAHSTQGEAQAWQKKIDAMQRERKPAQSNLSSTLPSHRSVPHAKPEAVVKSMLPTLGPDRPVSTSRPAATFTAQGRARDKKTHYIHLPSRKYTEHCDNTPWNKAQCACPNSWHILVYCPSPLNNSSTFKENHSSCSFKLIAATKKRAEVNSNESKRNEARGRKMKISEIIWHEMNTKWKRHEVECNKLRRKDLN